jgi:hypothetical protein
MTKKTLEDFMELVRDIDANGKGLTQWEIEFIASFIDRPRSTVSEKQWEALEGIKARRLK